MSSMNAGSTTPFSMSSCSSARGSALDLAQLGRTVMIAVIVFAHSDSRYRS